MDVFSTIFYYSLLVIIDVHPEFNHYNFYLYVSSISLTMWINFFFILNILQEFSFFSTHVNIIAPQDHIKQRCRNLQLSLCGLLFSFFSPHAQIKHPNFTQSFGKDTNQQTIPSIIMLSCNIQISSTKKVQCDLLYNCMYIPYMLWE